MRFYLVSPDRDAPSEDIDPTTEWMVAAEDIQQAAERALAHMQSQGDGRPSRVLVRPMTDPARWAEDGGPFSVPPDRKYGDEAFRALWDEGELVDVGVAQADWQDSDGTS